MTISRTGRRHAIRTFVAVLLFTILSVAGVGIDWIARIGIIVYGISWGIRFRRFRKILEVESRNGDRIAFGLTASTRIPLVFTLEWLAFGISVLWLALGLSPLTPSIWESRVGIILITLPLFMASDRFWTRALDLDDDFDAD